MSSRIGRMNGVSLSPAGVGKFVVASSIHFLFWTLTKRERHKMNYLLLAISDKACKGTVKTTGKGQGGLQNSCPVVS